MPTSSAPRYGSADGEAHTEGADAQYSYRSFGAHFVEVRWDPGISHLRVARVVSAIDVGRVINETTARNQVEGAIVMGVGMGLFEATEYDARNGRPVNNDYAEYVVPVHADQPEVDVILLDYPDTRFNEYGARGIGEIGITGLAAAVANAVYHATGKRIRELPITLDKLMDDVPEARTA
ncbi:xanthine dehydrogenase family protein molybdopterin-binding subunit [Salinicola tamaricis]|uniref:xanthine dehydrogenase family protein molybdopterin-binding subunit n=1 Tax=Salinicola tamaricis TaxID=1771309 RepID=UPI0030F38E11